MQECNARLLTTLICEVLQSSEFWPGLVAARTSTEYDRAPMLKRMWLSVGQTKRDQRREFKSGSYAELRVYFETSDHGFATDQHHWKTRESSLIAGDVKWLRDFKNILMMLGFSDKTVVPSKELCYSQNNMQGKNYVSLTVGSKFVNEWRALGFTDFVDLISNKQ